MSSMYLEAESTLINYARSVDKGIPVDFPNRELTVTPDDGPWLQFHNLRGETALATLGGAGENESRGIFQIDINVPKGRGSGQALVLGNKYEEAFPIGKKISYNKGNLIITIHKSALSIGRYVGNYYRVSLSLTYSYRTQRNYT